MRRRARENGDRNGGSDSRKLDKLIIPKSLYTVKVFLRVHRSDLSFSLSLSLPLTLYLSLFHSLARFPVYERVPRIVVCIFSRPFFFFPYFCPPTMRKIGLFYTVYTFSFTRGAIHNYIPRRLPVRPLIILYTYYTYNNIISLRLLCGRERERERERERNTGNSNVPTIEMKIRKPY
jgi:hypothetical protein